MHLSHFQSLSIEFEWERKLFQLSDTLIVCDQTLHIFGTLVALVLLKNFVVAIQLVDVYIALWTKELGSLAIILDVVLQPIREVTNIYWAERAFLLLRALSTFGEMALPSFIIEDLSAVVRAIELTHVQNIADLSRNFHFFEVCLTERTWAILGQPLVQAGSTDQTLTVSAACEIF